ncbi:hypothetical protein B7P43_G09399 [Cryptotermes secundus]|uniref:Peptidase M12B domain-containing protein n=1 Tax=Cryptotermes secundus TaxID=105785 RepID=A0A2J7R4T8_9NEOP|nr:hypothetical protein B7P43_G09399 [Cryptotermes secundus]
MVFRLLWVCFFLGASRAATTAAHRQEVNEANLRDLLTAAEWTSLLGTSATAPEFAVVRPRLPSKRGKRWALPDETSVMPVVFEAQSLGRRFELQFRPSPALLDPQFVLLRRWSNHTEMLSPHLAEQSCFYRSDVGHRAAVALCGGMRGIISSPNNEYYIINPLPRRFRRSSASIPHVVVRWTPPSLTTDSKTPSCASHHPQDTNKQIPDENSRTNSPDRDHRLQSNAPISAVDNSRTLNWSNNNNSKNSSTEHVYDLHISDKVELKKTEALTSKQDMSEESTKRSHKPSSGVLKTILLSSAESKTKLGYGALNAIEDVKKSSNCSEEEHSEVLRRKKRSAVLVPGTPIHVETAVFIDKDLYQHMALNFPTDTERELVRVVLAMINAVQLLYHDPSLGRQVNFVLKRLEILHVDPVSLQRPHDIDRFLSSFCTWQRGENPPADSDPLHWDHALILTGLDLYVVSKNGKVSSQVVGLAPVAGMCTATSSCTVNEGRHFESVYVVAHEIGHNLGMRHDGPSAENECDPGSYIMSPTLGSGKITWSSCSRRYLQMFLETPQSQCLLDHSSSGGQLDHSAEGALPGERFNADQQCMLKYGHGSIHAIQQPLDDVCRDLHCQRDRYTWTSHPALEGTFCGNNKWCRSGRCVGRGLSALQAGFSPNQRVDGAWSEWSPFSECASGCLYSEEGRLHAGSTGIMVSTRRCNNPRPENDGLPCKGSDHRYRTCLAEQCGNVQRTTIKDFADQICIRAREVDKELLGTGLQKPSSDPGEACTVWCYKRSGGSKSRGWTFPDGTTCQSHRSQYRKSMYCISGRCEEFVCDRYDAATFSTLPELCHGSSNGGGGRLQVHDSSLFFRNKGQRREVPETRIQWSPASGCHFNCLAPGRGLRLVVAKDMKCQLEDNCEGGRITSIQLCEPDKQGCGRLKTPFEHATTVCSKYRERVRRLSGFGMQISPVAQDPDRPCHVACQDDEVNHRFYLVNGEDGWFPFGTDCSRGVPEKRAYCISGKCLEFGSDDTPLHESEYTLPLLSRMKRSLINNSTKVQTRLDQTMLNNIISRLNFRGLISILSQI